VEGKQHMKKSKKSEALSGTQYKHLLKVKKMRKQVR
jgi:hypothetical protein